jgi:hypothetical protein
MKLLKEIIELATDNHTPLTVVLRKCLVLAYSLKNERLKTWVEKELERVWTRRRAARLPRRLPAVKGRLP